MNLYKVSRPEGTIGWDEYDALIVASETAKEARCIKPGSTSSGGDAHWYEWPVKPEDLIVELVGVINDAYYFKLIEEETRPILLASYING